MTTDQEGLWSSYIYIFFSCGAATQRGSWLPHSRGFLDHTQRRPTVGRTPLDERSARRRDLYLTTHNTHKTNIHAPGGIRTHDLSRLAAVDLRLRPRGHLDRHTWRLQFKNQVTETFWSPCISPYKISQIFSRTCYVDLLVCCSDVNWVTVSINLTPYTSKNLQLQPFSKRWFFCYLSKISQFYTSVFKEFSNFITSWTIPLPDAHLTECRATTKKCSPTTF